MKLMKCDEFSCPNYIAICTYSFFIKYREYAKRKTIKLNNYL